MKVGSIVVVKPIPIGWALPFVKWTPIQDEKTPYMVREVVNGELGIGIYLEEGVIGYGPDDLELGIHVEYVREVLPPEDISELIEECISEPILY